MGKNTLTSHIICQVGLVVRDIKEKKKAYAELFSLPEPEVQVTDPLEVARTRYKGEPTTARAKLAFFDMGQVSLELIEPLGGPSTWQAYLDEHGEGVHHIAFIIKDTDQVVASLGQVGIGVLQQGHYTGGMYTYVDSEPALGVILELLENFETASA
jgi:hypothetical protein